jgi:hypothetical protein
MGRWHSDAMMRYLYIQAVPIINNYAIKMFNEGTYTFQPDETVHIIKVYGNIYFIPQYTIPRSTNYYKANGINVRGGAAQLAWSSDRSPNLAAPWHSGWEVNSI